MSHETAPKEDIYSTIIVNGKPLGECTKEDLLLAAAQEREKARKLQERAERIEYGLKHFKNLPE